MRQVLTHREQCELTAPWRVAVADESWDAFPSEDHVTEADLSDLLGHTRTMADFNRRSNRGAAVFDSMSPDEQLDHFNDHIIPVWQKHGLPIKGKGRFLDFQDEVLGNWRGDPERTDGIRDP